MRRFVTRIHENPWRVALIPLGILFSFLLPLPKVLLDIGLCINFILSLTVIFWVFSLRSIHEAKIFPQLFLYLCLFRLGLNLSSTRMILSSGWASPLIFSLGNFFSLGCLGTGVIAFCLFFLVNFAVIAKGSERVAEVRARFVLEALPGKQMSLDADLISGRVSALDAEKTKQKLIEEGDFFSSMEGVFRFVKGDAIVSCVLLIVNMLAATYFSYSLEEHSASPWLTVVGDALVSQVPALLTSCAAATLISKVGQKESFLEHMTYYYHQARVYFRKIALLLSFLLFIPGMPKATILIFVLLLLMRHKMKEEKDLNLSSRKVAPLTIHISQEKEGEDPLSLYVQAREEIFQEMGVVFPQQPTIIYNERPSCIEYCGEFFYFKELSPVCLVSALRNLAPDFIHGRDLKSLMQDAQNIYGISVEEIIPKKISETALLFLIKSLVKERVSLRLFPRILETIALHGFSEERIEESSEKIRKHLGKHIGRALWNHENTLEVITVDAHVEKMIEDLYAQSHPIMCEKFVCEVHKLLGKPGIGEFRAIITGQESRIELRRMIEPYFPDLLVLSHNELPEEIPISLLGSVSDEVLTI